VNAFSLHIVNRKIWVLLFISGALFSCKKQNGNIVIEGQGADSKLALVRDTLKIRAVTVREDSLPANNLRYSLLGLMNDPELGRVTAGVYSQTGILEPVADFPNTETPDSAILHIPFISGINYYGDRLANVLLNVYPLSEAITSGIIYYQSNELKVDKSLESSYFGPLYHFRSDSIRYRKGKIKLEPGLRIKLSSQMASKLMSLPKEAYTSQENFLKNFNGLAILPSDRDLMMGTGGLGVYDFNNVISLSYRAKILLYYRDTQTFTFTFNSSKTTLNRCTTGPYPATILDQLKYPDSTFLLTWAQTPNGIKTRIQIPGLFDLVKNGNVAVNKAELIVYADQPKISDDFYAPPRLNLVQPANRFSDRNAIIEDATTNFGGEYNPADGSYRFIITRHLQNVLNAKALRGVDVNYGLYITVPSDQPVTGARIPLNHSKTKLFITYTKLN
jgi:hypothetical protein